MDFSLGSIHNLLDEAYELAEKKHDTVSFEFNGRDIRVNEDSNRDDIMRHFWRESDRTSVIGPYPDPAETEEDRRLASERGGVIICTLHVS